MNSSARAEGDGSAGYQCISVLSCPGMRNVLRAKSVLSFLGFIFVALPYVRAPSCSGSGLLYDAQDVYICYETEGQRSFGTC